MCKVKIRPYGTSHGTHSGVSQRLRIRAELRKIARFTPKKVQTVERTVNDILSRLRVKLSDA
jgi:hypothetical protein